MARAGWKFRGVVSFHGTLGALSSASSLQYPAFDNANITAKILVLHGYGDRGVTPASVRHHQMSWSSVLTQVFQVRAFQHEMSKKKVDWQICYYANVTDFFTKPNANVPGRAMYDAVADKRSWNAMKNFFQEVFE